MALAGDLRADILTTHIGLMDAWNKAADYRKVHSENGALLPEAAEEYARLKDCVEEQAARLERLDSHYTFDRNADGTLDMEEKPMEEY